MQIKCFQSSSWHLSVRFRWLIIIPMHPLKRKSWGSLPASLSYCFQTLLFFPLLSVIVAKATNTVNPNGHRASAKPCTSQGLHRVGRAGETSTMVTTAHLFTGIQWGRASQLKRMVDHSCSLHSSLEAERQGVKRYTLQKGTPPAKIHLLTAFLADESEVN